MKASEFDSRLRDILDAEEVQVDPEQWNRLAAVLPGARVRISRRLVNWMRAVGWAAGIALIAGGGYAYLKSDGQHPENAAVQQQLPAANPAAIREQQPAAAIAETALPADNAGAAASASGTGSAFVAGPRSGKTAAASTGRRQQSVDVMPIGHDQTYSEPVGTPGDEPAAPRPRPSLAASAPAPERQGGLGESFVPAPETLPGKTRNSTALGIAGAYRYGGENAGYALGLSIRQPLGRRLFIDGDVAYVGNSRSTSTSRMDAETYDRLANPAPDGGGTASRQPLPATAAASLSYLQVAPALSYQVLPALSIGAGPDVQRIISQAPGTAEDQLVQYDQTTAPEYIPAVDWGLTGKLEYSIGNRLRAGVQYRRGLNNSIRNEPGITYIERHYMQVQLRVFLLK